MPKLTFNQIYLGSVPESQRFVGIRLSLDPGHTTGYAVWKCDVQGASLLEAGQVTTWTKNDMSMDAFIAILDKHPPHEVVFETYQIYEWKSDDHSWSQIPTVQIIGAMKMLFIQRGIKYVSQTAQVAKQFCTDEKLEQWGFYTKGLRHARDAIRHGCYRILFGHKNS